jgi:valyl-tRNA synthetase
MTTLQELVTEVRRLRKEYGVPEGRLIGIYVSGATDSFVTAVKGQSAALEQLAGIQGIESDVRSGVGAHGVLSNGAELFMPLEGVIDLDRERERLNEAIGRLDGLLEGAKNRLENEAFVSRAPKEVVQKEHDKAAQLEEQRVKLRIKLDGLEATGSE